MLNISGANERILRKVMLFAMPIRESVLTPGKYLSRMARVAGFSSRVPILVSVVGVMGGRRCFGLLLAEAEEAAGFFRGRRRLGGSQGGAASAASIR